jgi:hypothetical protein
MLKVFRELIGFAEYAAPAVIAVCGGALFLAFLVRGAAV